MARGTSEGCDRPGATLDTFDIYEGAIARALGNLRTWEACYTRERSAAAGLVAELLARSGEQRKLILRNSRRFNTWGVCERLVAEAWDVARTSPRQAETLADLALRVADRLDVRYGRPAIEDLRTRSWTCLGTARCRRADLAGAEQALRSAYRHLRRGTGDPVELALFLDLAASLLSARRKFCAALRLLRGAHAAFLSVGDRQRAGRALRDLSREMPVSP